MRDTFSVGPHEWGEVDANRNFTPDPDGPACRNCMTLRPTDSRWCLFVPFKDTRSLALAVPFDAIHDPGCNCWPHVSQRATQERINALTHALRETLSLAFVANEGDPWFATEAGIDAEAVLARAREVLEAPVEGEPR